MPEERYTSDFHLVIGGGGGDDDDDDAAARLRGFRLAELATRKLAISDSDGAEPAPRRAAGRRWLRRLGATRALAGLRPAGGGVLRWDVRDERRGRGRGGVRRVQAGGRGAVRAAEPQGAPRRRGNSAPCPPAPLDVRRSPPLPPLLPYLRCV